VQFALTVTKNGKHTNRVEGDDMVWSHSADGVSRAGSRIGASIIAQCARQTKCDASIEAKLRRNAAVSTVGAGNNAWQIEIPEKQTDRNERENESLTKNVGPWRGITNCDTIDRAI